MPEIRLFLSRKQNLKGGTKNVINAFGGSILPPIIAPVLEVLNALLWPCIAIVGAVGTIYCIFLGIKIAKSDEQNSREKQRKT